LVENPVTVDWQKFQDRRRRTRDVHCVTAWSRYDNRWRGVLVSDLLALVRPTPDARFVLLQSYDTYTTNLPLAEFAVPGALLATHWEGKSAKWAHRLRRGRPAWLLEVPGYHDHGDP
jgi:DMSO/TMAO reductase YedYZ molybdopterin-dependent catalytic subunit